MTPTGLPTEKQTARLLAWVNRQRKKLGREPRKRLAKGKRCEACECPIARSLGSGVSVGLTDWGDEGQLPLPLYVSTFIRRFDAGEYPGLEVGG